MHLLFGWLLNIIFGCTIFLLLSIFWGKNLITDKKVEELEFVIRTTALTYSWVILMSLLAFSVFNNFFSLYTQSGSKWDPLFYLIVAIITYVISYIMLKRKYA